MQLTDKDGNIFGTGGLEITTSTGKPKIPVINTDITIGTTAIVGGVSGRLLYDDAGVVGETNGASWDTAGFLGIGTSTPVNPSGYNGITINSTSLGAYVWFQTSGVTKYAIGSEGNINYHNLVAGTSFLIRSGGSNYFNLVQSTGNIQIGTTTDAGYKLDVNGNARITTELSVGILGTNGHVYLNRASTGGNVGGIRAQAGGSEIGGGGFLDRILCSNGVGLFFYTYGGSGSVSTQRMQIFGTSGNVLIQSGGTFTDAGYKLDVNGTARVIATHQIYRNNQIGAIDLNLYNGQSGWQGGVYYNTETGGAGQRLTFYSGGALGSADGLTIFASRNVLIQNGGTHTDTGFRLDINGIARTQQLHTFLQGAYLDSTSANYFYRSDTGGSSYGGLHLRNQTQDYSAYIQTGRSGSSNGINFYHTTFAGGTVGDTQQKFTAGSVRFGTNSFANTLNVIFSGGASGTVNYPIIVTNQLNTTNTGVGYLFQTGDSTGAGPINHAAISAWKTNGAAPSVTSSLRFYTINDAANTLTEKMRIADSGNLLIGTTTDSGQKLQIVGEQTTSVTGTGNGFNLTRIGNYNNISLTTLATITDTTSNANMSKIGLFVNISGASNNIAIQTVGAVGVGVTPLSNTFASGYFAYLYAGATINSVADYNLNVRSRVSSYFAGNGGGISFWGDDRGQAGASTAFAGIRGVKENNGYLNGLGALTFLTQVSSAGLSTESTFVEVGRFTSGGNLLIGTTVSNSYKLEVNGTGYFGSNLRVNGTITASTPTANTYICHIALTTDQVLVSGADALLDFVDVADTNNWYDPTTKKFLPTVAGYYHVDFSLWFEPSPVSTGQYNIQVRKNGTTVMIAQQPTINNGTGQSLMSSKLVYFNGTTDYIDFTAYQSTGSNRNIWKGTDSSGTYATIHLLAV